MVSEARGQLPGVGEHLLEDRHLVVHLAAVMSNGGSKVSCQPKSINEFGNTAKVYINTEVH